MRRYVVTQFNCAKCGCALDVSYDRPRSVESVSDGITGAAKVEMCVFVQPCSACMRPLDEIRHALKTLGIAANCEGEG